MATSFKTLISASQLETTINHPDLRLFDCRFNLLDEQKGFTDFRQGHIENSQYANLNTQLAGAVLKNTGRHPLPAKDQFEKQLQLWGIDESCQIVAYDDASGSIAARLWWLCKWAGLDHVAVLDGGLNSWKSSHRQLSKKFNSFERTDFQASYNDELWVSTQTVQILKKDPDTLITDARAVRRFNGETEPIDQRAGHIPGAVNFPFENNLGPEGCFLSKEQLLSLHQQNTEKTRVISMCGSGVTACHNILARMHAGLNPGQLYAGSWSEWITDPERDINTGHV